MQVNKFKKIVIKLGSSTVIDKKGKFKSGTGYKLVSILILEFFFISQ